jgi:hypothetical protein
MSGFYSANFMQSTFQQSNRKQATSPAAGGFNQHPSTAVRHTAMREPKPDQVNPFGNALVQERGQERVWEQPADRYQNQSHQAQRPQATPAMPGENTEPTPVREQARVDFLAAVRPMQKADRALAIGLNKAWRKSDSSTSYRQTEGMSFLPPEIGWETESDFGSRSHAIIPNFVPSPHFLAEA